MQASRLNIEQFISLAKKYADFAELTPGIINEFVSKIIVHEAVGKGAHRTMDIEIYLNYIGRFQLPTQLEELSPEEKEKRAKEQEKLERKRATNRKYMKNYRKRQKEAEVEYERRKATEEKSA